MKIKKCHKCHTELTNNSKKCENCGYEKRLNTTLLITLLCILVIVVNIIFIIYSYNYSNIKFNNYSKENELLKESYLNAQNIIAKNNLIDTATKFKNEQNYYEAITTLTSNETFSNDADIISLKDTISEEMKNYNNNLISELKGKLNIGYDNTAKTYYIVPKSYQTTTRNISENINIDPIILLQDNGTVGMILYCGFIAKDFIFTDNVYFANNNENLTYKADYNNSDTEVLNNGYIYENIQLTDIYCTLDYAKELGKEFPEFSKELTKSNVNIDKILNIIISDNSNLRFAGKGMRNHQILQEEKNNVNLLYKTFLLLKNDPKCIESLK